MRQVFTISNFGAEPKLGFTDDVVVDKGFIQVQMTDGIRELIHKAFVFDIKHLELYQRARVKRAELIKETDTLMLQTLNEMRK